MFNPHTATTDELLDMLHWIKMRQSYRRACNITDGAAYAEECKTEDETIFELERRNYFNWR